jgi:hypothetical protein
MRDVELYRAILGLTPPWTVAGVDLDVPGQQVVVHVEAGPGPFPCPECGTPTPRPRGGPYGASANQGTSHRSSRSRRFSLDFAGVGVGDRRGVRMLARICA